MSKTSFLKLLIFPLVLTGLFTLTTNARPEYLKLYAADPFSRPELRNKCSICHVNPAGGGPRNDFGKAFLDAGFQITPQLRQQWPNLFTTERNQQQALPPVTFIEGSNSEAVLEWNGKRYVINTRDKTVNELAPDPTINKPALATTAPQNAEREQPSDVYRQVDVRLINLPTAIPIPKGSLWSDFTHRFPFGEPTNKAEFFGLDSIAVPAFGFTYGITDYLHVGGYRAPTNVGRPINFYLGVNPWQETKGHPLSFQARVGIEGRDNFQRNFTTSFEFSFARSITRHAQIYVVPTVSVGDRPLGSAEQNLPGETAVALGAGLAVNIRPSVALMAEANMRLNEASRYVDPNSPIGIRRPAFGFGLQKASASRRHAFSLVFTNGHGTTMSQRSITRGLLGADDGWQGLTIGFNLSRRLF